MNYRAILLGSLQLLVIVLLLLSIAAWFEISAATGPQVLTLSSLLVWPGLYAALRGKDGGILHGLLTGVLGAVWVLVALAGVEQWMQLPPLVSQLTSKGAVIIVILCGFWCAIGGIFADIVRVRRLKKRARNRE